MPRLPRHPAIWFSALLGWFGVLWFLSSLQGAQMPPLLPFPDFDKLEHFSYFLAGGVLCAGWRFRLQPEQPAWGKILVTVIIAVALIGVVDEWHQCYTPGRSGGDPWDWLADLLGGTAGAFSLKFFHRHLQ